MYTIDLLTKMAENYLSPVSDIKNPQILRTKQFVRKMNWDSLTTLTWIAGVIMPIIFAFSYSSFFQLLKVLYIPLAIMVAASIFNYRSVGLWISNLLYFVPSLIIIGIIEGINSLSPSPWWYRAMVLLQIWIFWKTQREIPKLEKQEWAIFKSLTGMTEEDIIKSLDLQRESNSKTEAKE